VDGFVQKKVGDLRNHHAAGRVLKHVSSFLNHGGRVDGCDIATESCNASSNGKEEIKMNRRSVVGVMVIGASLLAGEAMYAAPVAVASPVHAMFSMGKMVKFNLRNGSDAPMTIKAGDTEMTLQPGKVVQVKLAVGVKIVAEEATAHTAKGTILAVVYAELGDATLVLN
jgi:hypothetical protein